MRQSAAALGIAVATTGALLPAAVAAQAPEVPPMVTQGLEAFATVGTDSALAVWFAGAPMDSPHARETMRRAFATMRRQAGEPDGFDVVQTHAVGSRVRRVYAVLHFDVRPGFLVLDVYRAPGGWTLQNIAFNDDAEKVFPPALLNP